MFPEYFCRSGARGGRVGWNWGSHLRSGWSSFSLFLCDPCAWRVRFGWHCGRDDDRYRFGGLLQHHDLLHLFLPGAESGSREWARRCWRLDWCERSRRNLRSRLYFGRWRGSRRLAQRFQEFTDPVRVAFRLGSLDRLRVFRPRAGSARRLRRSLLFLRTLRDFRNQSRDADDRRDDDEDDVLIEVHLIR